MLGPNPFKGRYKLKCQTVFLTTNILIEALGPFPVFALGVFSSLISVTIFVVHASSPSFGERKANYRLMGTGNTTPTNRDNRVHPRFNALVDIENICYQCSISRSWRQDPAPDGKIPLLTARSSFCVDCKVLSITLIDVFMFDVVMSHWTPLYRVRGVPQNNVPEASVRGYPSN